MFAVIKTGGKQYKVAKDDVIVVESLEGDPGSMVELEDVLMIGRSGEEPKVGHPVLDEAAVFAEVVKQTRGDKIIVFKKQRRKGYRRKAGHRQNQTVLKIVDISSDGKRTASPAKPKATVKPEAVTKPEAAAKPEAATKPEAAAKPKAATKPEAAAKPEAATKPETVTKPKATAKPKAAAKPKE